MKIFIAEDEKSLSRAVSKILQINGYDVEASSDGEEASRMLSSNEYDCVVLDIMMPKKSGFEVLREMRERNNDTPVIMLTAKTEIDDKLSGFELGADDYLTKPFNMKELVARIGALTKDSANKNDEYDFADLMIKYDGTMANGTATCSIDPVENDIARMLSKSVSRPISLNRFEEKINESSLSIRIKISYLNGKMNALGSEYEIIEQDTGYIIARKNKKSNH